MRFNCRPADLFISYHHSDKAFGDRICAALESNGVLSWIAPRDVPAGKEWAESIVDAIEHARAMLVVFSTQSNNSPQVKREVERAVHFGLPIITVGVEPVEPSKTMSYLLGAFHWLDAFGSPLDAFLADLIGRVKLLLTALPVAQHPATAERPGEDPSMRVLQTLLNQLSRLLPTLKASRGPQADEAARIVRAQVLEALPKMNPEQKGITVRALHLAGLVQELQPSVDLAGADLSGADLVGAMLPRIRLFNVDLNRADLRGANLANGTLQWASINGTRFDGACLDGVTIVRNEIEDAKLDPTFLRSLGADIRRPD